MKFVQLYRTKLQTNYVATVATTRGCCVWRNKFDYVRPRLSYISYHGNGSVKARLQFFSQL